MTAYTKNFVTDYSAPTDGTSSCYTAGNAFRTFLGTLSAGDSVILTIPNSTQGGPSNNTYNFKTTASVGLIRGVLGGVIVTINGNNTTLSDAGSAFGFNFSSATLEFAGSGKAFVDSVNVGSTTVRLKTLSDYSQFAVNQWLIVCGIDLQTVAQPPHAALLEYVQITAINTGTGVITFTPALTQGYLDTWPTYDLDASQSGAATILGYDPIWDVTATINDLTIDQNTVQTYATAKSITLNNVTCTGSTTIVGTSCRDFSTNNCTLVGTVEVDQLLGTSTYSSGTAHRFSTQSMGAVYENFDGITFDAGSTIAGGGRYVSINNCTIDGISIGANGYGRSDRYIVRNSTIGSVNSFNISSNEQNISASCTMANGIITIPSNVISPITWCVPGTWMFYSGGGSGKYNLGTFRIVDVRQNGINTLIQTDQTGTWPTLLGAGNWNIRVHNCPQWFASNNVGCADIVDLSQSGAQGKPIFSYSKRKYQGNVLRNTIPIELWGTLSQININVMTPYTGALTLTAQCLGNLGTSVLNASKTALTTLNPTINLKVAGTRTYTVSGATGLQSGDTAFSAPGAVWLVGNGDVLSPFASRDISGEASNTWPIVEIEIITDQGISYKVPFKLGMHV